MEEEIKVAVEWWVSHLTIIKDNGDKEASLFPTLLNARFAETLTPEDISAFKQALTNRFRLELARRKDALSWGFGVDYDPEPPLSDAARDAGLYDKLALWWPWKTVMWLKAGQVKVRAGYGRDPEVIYGQPE